jgi:hypothetical protein
MQVRFTNERGTFTANQELRPREINLRSWLADSPAWIVGQSERWSIDLELILELRHDAVYFHQHVLLGSGGEGVYEALW